MAAHRRLGQEDELSFVFSVFARVLSFGTGVRESLLALSAAIERSKIEVG